MSVTLKKSIRLPFKFTNGKLEMVPVDNSTNEVSYFYAQKIVLLAGTVLGTFIFDRKYGTSINDLLMSPNNVGVAGKVLDEIRKTCSIYLPYMIIDKVNSVAENEELYLDIWFNIRESGQRGKARVLIGDLPG